MVDARVDAKMTYKFSPSSLSLLKDCPKCFWLQFNKGIKRPDSILFLLFGGALFTLKDIFIDKLGKIIMKTKMPKITLYGKELYEER